MAIRRSQWSAVWLIAVCCALAGAVTGTAVSASRHLCVGSEPAEYMPPGDSAACDSCLAAGRLPLTTAAAVVSGVGLNRLPGQDLHGITDFNAGVDILCRTDEAPAALSLTDGVVERAHAGRHGTLTVGVRGTDGALTVYRGIAADSAALIARQVRHGDTLGAVAIQSDGRAMLHIERWMNGNPVELNLGN